MAKMERAFNLVCKLGGVQKKWQCGEKSPHFLAVLIEKGFDYICLFDFNTFICILAFLGFGERELCFCFSILFPSVYDDAAVLPQFD